MAMRLEDISFYANKNLRSLSRCSNLKNPGTANAAIQAIAQAQNRRLGSSGDNNNSNVQVKFMVTKKELKQMVASMGWVKNSGNGGVGNNQKLTSAALEQLLHALKKKHSKKSDCARSDHVSNRWEPALQSIPEEL